MMDVSVFVSVFIFSFRGRGAKLAKSLLHLKARIGAGFWRSLLETNKTKTQAQLRLLCIAAVATGAFSLESLALAGRGVLPCATPPPFPLSTMRGGASSSIAVDLTNDAEMGGAEKVRDSSMMDSLKCALKVKMKERRVAEELWERLRDEERDLEASIQALQEQEESAMRERNRPDWAKATFEWDVKVFELLQRTFKLPAFRPLQREVGDSFVFAHSLDVCSVS